ncbi:MAG: TlyA family RNA methyltransferase [Betaproteobacteria bacterium]|nr:TlyA family RNA methyltransferase [Betaproteobacteria bacterium]
MRADQLLVERGLAATRSQAQRLIAAGVLWRLGASDWQRVDKNGTVLSTLCELQLLDDAETRYVSRGGLKLDAALHHVGFKAAGCLCLDLGQSTGGFTDCLLQHGASQVWGVDVGHGQLHPSLQPDPRVHCVEKSNARDLQASDLGPNAPKGFDLLVADLSFISITLVLPVMAILLKPAGTALVLIKPQFELQANQLGKGGIVKNPALYEQVETRVRQACQSVGLDVLEWFACAIHGGDGNQEFFIHARRA